MFDGRLADVVLKVVDVSYGGENGFNQAIELAGETLRNVKFLQEKKLICKFMEEIALDTGKICFGIAETVEALSMGAVETLIVWESLDVLTIYMLVTSIFFFRLAFLLSQFFYRSESHI